MWIKIAARLRPFSHSPGASCLLPGSDLLVQVFPALLKIGDKEIPLEIEGPMQEFTLMQDLERGEVVVFGKTARGYVRYKIRQASEGVAIEFEKFPSSREALLIPHCIPPFEVSKARLSLGMHKAQDCELIRRRCDLKEILPLLFSLAQHTPKVSSATGRSGTLLLIDRCNDLIKSSNRVNCGAALRALFLAGFSSLFMPRLIDDDHQGIVPADSMPPAEASPLQLLQETGALIGSLFFAETIEGLHFLPCLPPEFHAGRFTSLQTTAGDEIDMEWSKKQLRRVEIRAGSGRETRLILQKGISSFRVRTSLKDKGCTHAVSDPLPLDPAHPLFLDRFS